MIYLLFLSSLFFLPAFASLARAGLTAVQDSLYHLIFQRVLHLVSHSPYDMSTIPEVASVITKIRSGKNIYHFVKLLIFNTVYFC